MCHIFTSLLFLELFISPYYLFSSCSGHPHTVLFLFLYLFLTCFLQMFFFYLCVKFILSFERFAVKHWRFLPIFLNLFSLLLTFNLLKTIKNLLFVAFHFFSLFIPVRLETQSSIKTCLMWSRRRKQMFEQKCFDFIPLFFYSHGALN